MNFTALINNKRIVLALGMIVAVAAIVIASTGAFFSDTETSAANIFTAGSIDLTVDHTKQTYNGIDCKTCNVEIVSDTTNEVTAPVATTSAVLVSQPHPAWTADVDGSEDDADWIWATDPTLAEDTTNGITYTFRKEFTWMGPIAGATLDLAVAADNGYEVWLNGVNIGGDSSETNFSAAGQDEYNEGNSSIEDNILQGVNVLEIKVTNKPLDADPVTGNPGGLLYKLVIDGNCDEAFFQNQCQLWNSKDLEDEKFFNFEDIKPGDYGTNVISLHVTSNDAYACLMSHDMEDADNGITEPESDDGDTTDGAGNGELDTVLKFGAWDDVNQNGTHEAGEEVFVPAGTAFSNAVLADLAIVGDGTSYVGIAWCAGTQTGPATDADTTAFTCDGSTVDNQSQSDSLALDLTAYAVQQRNNDNFTCSLDLIGEDGDDESDWVETTQADGDAEEADGVLTLTTADDVNSRVRYTNEGVPADLDLEDVSGFVYDSRQVSATDTVNGNASFRLVVDLEGDGTVIKDITFEPYYNITAHNSLNDASIVPNTWQTWEATQTDGKFWASGVTTAAGASVGGGAYATNFTLAELSAAYPDAKVLGVSIGMGTYNVNQVVEVDNLNFNTGMITGF